MNRFLLLFLLVVVFSAMHGCDSDDRRLAEMANEASRRQAEQNVEMAQLNREVAANNRRVVESSNNITNLQRELQTERRDLANQHRHESLLAPIVATLGGILICVLPLVVCLRLFHALGDESTNDGMVELLLQRGAATLILNNAGQKPVDLAQSLIPRFPPRHIGTEGIPQDEIEMLKNRHRIVELLEQAQTETPKSPAKSGD